jgi:uncharacterized damage-inducible protein DinB
MVVDLSLNDLLDYTDWERQEWHGWFGQRGASALKVSAGPHGDGRFGVVGELVRHIFSAEKRYVERLSGRPLTDPASIPADSVDALFQFGRESRSGLQEFIATFPAQDWDVPQDFTILNTFVRVTPRKIVIHIVMHEIRHWAQIATLLRLHGLTSEFHDFLASPILGGEFRRQQGKP